VVSTSSKLLKKLVTPFFIGFGAFEYVWATGFKKFRSRDSLNSKATLFISQMDHLYLLHTVRN
jgi:hypothetical protein